MTYFLLENILCTAQKELHLSLWVGCLLRDSNIYIYIYTAQKELHSRLWLGLVIALRTLKGPTLSPCIGGMLGKAGSNRSTCMKHVANFWDGGLSGSVK